MAFLLTFVLTTYYALVSMTPWAVLYDHSGPGVVGRNESTTPHHERADVVVHYLGPEKELDCLELFAELGVLPLQQA
eukprot:SAG31_NODE_2596_length_5420_cov_45.220330_8_plen_77_part_00